MVSCSPCILIRHGQCMPGSFKTTCESNRWFVVKPQVLCTLFSLAARTASSVDSQTCNTCRQARVGFFGEKTNLQKDNRQQHPMKSIEIMSLLEVLQYLLDRSAREPDSTGKVNLDNCQTLAITRRASSTSTGAADDLALLQHHLTQAHAPY